MPDDTARRHRAAFPPDCKESLESLHPPAYQSVRRCKGETGHQTSQIGTPYAAVSQARPEKSRDAASVGAALSQLRLQFGAGEPRLYRPDVARLFQERQDRLRRAAPERRCHQLRLLHRRLGGFHADPLYEGGLSGVQYFVCSIIIFYSQSGIHEILAESTKIFQQTRIFQRKSNT